MNKLLLFLLAIGCGLLAFCWWGLETAAGQAAFPEMAGLYPFYAGGLGVAVVLLALVVSLGRRWRATRRLRSSSK